MSVREFTKSGAFVASVFALVVVLLPFAIEQIGEASGLFAFPVQKTIRGWFAGPAPVRQAVAKSVDWERYRQDLETFTAWAEGQRAVMISLPTKPVVIHVKEDVRRPVRRIWSVPVVSCTARDPLGRRKGYVFVSGYDGPYREGTVIAPSETLCGYEIVFVGERTVWFRAMFGHAGEAPMGIGRFPEFTRVEDGCLVKGNRKYVAQDAFPLASGGWLMLDSFMPPDGAVFKILDENRRVVAQFLCVVIGEKGGR